MKRWNYDDLIERLRNATALPMIQSLCNEAADAIQSLTAADVRPVVLCKECLHEDCAMYHSPNWFCADGEKMEES